ncbi:MAG: HAD-IA family hydrolase [Clostridiales bacterium]|nr:HAD-IA family hydrolase [Clostridiales bacterium]
MKEKKIIIFMDSGDTLVNEGTEIRNEKGIVVKAELFPGAATMLQALKEKEHKIILVADGEVESFKNVFALHGITNFFDEFVISERVGVQKPDAKMFQRAMEKGKLVEEDKSRIVMIGNNLKKDIVGANRFGIRSVLIDLSPRYDMVPKTAEEEPTYRIHTPMELVELVEKLEGE